ncbi:MAG: AraC family transcriptional regulator [Pseudomonadota bacterium]
MSDIAEILGYAESSVLTRAFQRWYGVSPRAARNGAV